MFRDSELGVNGQSRKFWLVDGNIGQQKIQVRSGGFNLGRNKMLTSVDQQVESISGKYIGISGGVWRKWRPGKRRGGTRRQSYGHGMLSEPIARDLI